MPKGNKKYILFNLKKYLYLELFNEKFVLT